jgi:hypothetical protein
MVILLSALWQVPHVLPFPSKVSPKNKALPTSIRSSGRKQRGEVFNASDRLGVGFAAKSEDGEKESGYESSTQNLHGILLLVMRRS